MSCHNPKYDWLLVELTVCVVMFAAGMMLIMSGCPSPAFAQQAVVSGETLDAQLARQRQQLGIGETQYTCPPSRTQYVPGPAGPPGRDGQPGPPGEVDYTRVEAMIRQDGDEIAAALNKALAEWRQDANQIDSDLASRINNNANVIGQWSTRIDELDARLEQLGHTTRPGGGSGITPSAPPPDSLLGGDPLATLAIAALGAAGIAVPWWGVLLIRGAWRVYRRNTPTPPTQPAVGRPPVEPFRTDTATAATSRDFDPAECDYEDGE